MSLSTLSEDAFHFALLHHMLDSPEDLADLLPAPHVADPAAAA